MRNTLGALVALTSLAAATATAIEGASRRADTAATPAAFGAGLTFSIAIPYDRAVLAVSGAAGLVFDKEFSPGVAPAFSASPDRGPLPDGRYTYALRLRQATGARVTSAQAEGQTAAAERTITRRGSFLIRGGSIVLDETSRRTEEVAR